MTKPLQIGERTRTRLDTNVSSTMANRQEIKARIEEIEEFVRLDKLRQAHADGKVSALSVSYLEIAKDFSVLDNVTPISREPDIDGKIVLWEGYSVPKAEGWFATQHNRGTLHRVIQHANGHRVYCRYNSRDQRWIVCNAKTKDGTVIPNRFPMPMFSRASAEDWGDVGSNTEARSVMKKNGSVEQRVFGSANQASAYKPYKK